MTAASSDARRHHDCKTDPGCQHVAYFEARVVAANGQARDQQTRMLCAVHLGEVVNDLAEWARGQGITDGQVMVLIAAPPPYDPHVGGAAHFPFGSIPIGA